MSTNTPARSQLKSALSAFSAAEIAEQLEVPPPEWPGAVALFGEG